MNITYRSAQNSDGTLISDWLWQPGVLRYFPLMNQKEIDDAIRILLSYIPRNSAYIAEVDGVAVGAAVIYLNLFQRLSHQALFMIIVDEKYRGKGIGADFLRFLKKEAKEKHHLKKLHLEVYEGNPAQRLYQREGFREYGRHPHFLKENNEYITKIMMEQEL